MAPLGMERLFGWIFQRDDPTPEPISFAPREHDDGAATIAATGAFGVYVDLDGTIRSEVELINRYRSMEQVAAVDCAVDEIAGEVIVPDDGLGIKIVLDDLKQSDTVKKAIEDAFNEVLDLLDWRNNGYNIFKRWYIDGRIYFHSIIDETDKESGLQELRYIDPRKIRKIREVIKKQIRGGQPGQSTADAIVQQTRNEYYVFSDKGFNLGTARPLTTSYPITGLKIAKDAILHITSGLTDAAGSMTLSFLHKAIKPLNMFSTLKDAAVIYRLSRAPERRVWYVDVGNLPRFKAEQYVKSIMDKYRTRLNYDISSGEVRDDRRFMTMLEDFWLPRKSDGQGTKVDVLPPGTGFNQIDDILFFQKELYQSLHVPVNRIDSNDMFPGPVATEITRDEIKFGKFIARLRRRFSKLFIWALEKQLVLKGIMSLEDFEKIKNKIDFQYSKDNPFQEAKENQVNTMRATLLQLMAPYVGRYYSDEWIRKHVLNQTDEEIEEIDKQIQEESMNPQFQGMPGQPPMEGEEGAEGEEGGDSADGNAGVIVDPNAVGEPPEGAQPQPKGQAKKPAGKTGGSFKSVGKLLARNT